MSDDVSLVVRGALPTDLNFIRRTWLSGLHELPTGLPDEFWWPAARSYVESALFSEAHRVLVLGASDDAHEILAWACGSKEILEWVHVRKGKLRGNGLAGVLLRRLGYDKERPPLARWRTRQSDRLRFLYRPSQLRSNRP